MNDFKDVSDYTLDNNIKYSTPFKYPDEEEDVNYVREKGKEFLKLFSLTLTYIINSKNPQLSAYAIALALKFVSITDNKTGQDIASLLGVTNSWLTQEKKKYLKYVNLENL